ncbi:MAG: Ig-like domain-containing protein [Candidatus Marinimicrobia bacterium]|nr:Ig-like domain-containing protein [Candidatus Neomarinimicrobiota bacterium]
MRPTTLPICLFIACAFLCIQCASESAPGGGPADKTPPNLIASSIQSGATLVPIDQNLSFVFSENLNTDVAEKSITIFPLSDDMASTIVKGKNITISPISAWDPNVVYTIILGKNISDYRGNGLPQPLQFSFTPGKNMPENRISGKISGLKKGTTAVISISRRTSQPDSILLYPEFYTQSGPEGNFVFEHLPLEKFNVAAYIDLDKSNSFKAKFDGVCVPSQPTIIPDTTDKPLVFEAIYDNFFPGRLLQAESIQPTISKLTFQKELATWNNIDNFRINSLNVDTIIYAANVCTLYHKQIETDTFLVELTSLLDHIDIPIADTSLMVPLTVWPDSFYHFTNLGNYLLVSPPPSSDKLEGLFQSPGDTSSLILDKYFSGFYTLPANKVKRQGTWQVHIPFADNRPRTVTDSLYSVPLQLKPEDSHGSVIGDLDIEDLQGLRLLLHNARQSYDIEIHTKAINFNKVLPGTYMLSYYIDRNANGHRDVGRPYPYLKPEILHDLDTGIDVRARWDTDLSEPYKIVIENE